MNVPSAESEGTVVAQNPPPGSQLGREEFVRINVSTRGGGGGGGTTTSGAQEIPDLVGLTQADASAELEAAGFSVSVVPEPTSDPGEEGLVLRQDPPAGRAAPGSQVTTAVGELTG